MLPARLNAPYLVRPSRSGGAGPLAPPPNARASLSHAARTAAVPPQVCYMPFASMANGEGPEAVGAVATTGAKEKEASQTAETAEAPSEARVVCKVRL